MAHTLTRRGFLQASGSATLMATLAGCGFGVGGQGGGNAATVWDISTGEEQQLLKDIVKAFNSSDARQTMKAQFFQNDPYKNKLRVSLGSDAPPDLFYNWGGGILESYVQADTVQPLGDGVDTDRFLSSVMEAVTFDGQVYGFPNGGMDPVVFFYSKPIFAENGLEPPATWADLLEAVRTLRGGGVTPISLAGKNIWPGMMYEEYLVDRIGGPQVFQRVLDGEPKAWSDPAFVEANTMIQELVRMDAFPPGFNALDYDTGQSTQLLYTGDAAMQLMGAWDYAGLLSDAPDFMEQGNLGWFPFPAVEGGSGDPRNIAGNVSTFYSIAAESTHKDAAEAFLNDAVMGTQHVRRLVDLGAVPPVTGVASELEQSPESDWLLFIYNLAQEAPHFDLSWDQALAPEAAADLLTNLDLLFLLDITPTEFSSRMNETLGAGR
jgi:raffinose/stachyose/melibiose transport system substrate-binding protein